MARKSPKQRSTFIWLSPLQERACWHLGYEEICVALSTTSLCENSLVLSNENLLCTMGAQFHIGTHSPFPPRVLL